MQNGVAETLQGKISYMDLLYTIEPTILRIMKHTKLEPEKYNDYFIFAEDFRPLGLTVEGAFMLLIALDYLKLVD